MTPLDRYIEWKTANADRFQEACDFIQSRYGTTRPDIMRSLKALEVWLEANGTTKKANKRDWYKFVLNWLKPRDWQKPVQVVYKTVEVDRGIRSNAGAQKVGDFLGRVFKATVLNEEPWSAIYQTQRPVKAVLHLTCPRCGAKNVPTLHPFESQMICGLCYAKTTI